MPVGKEELAYRKKIRTYSKRLVIALSILLGLAYLATSWFDTPDFSLYFVISGTILNLALFALSSWSLNDHFHKHNMNKKVGIESTRSLAEPVCDEKFLGESQMSNAEYSNVFEERNQVSTTKLPSETELYKRSTDERKQLIRISLDMTSSISSSLGGIISLVGSIASLSLRNHSIIFAISTLFFALGYTIMAVNIVWSCSSYLDKKLCKEDFESEPQQNKGNPDKDNSDKGHFCHLIIKSGEHSESRAF